MNKNNMLKWIEALESGAYGQGQGYLQSMPGAFCCLGVACDIAAKEVGGEWQPPQSGLGLRQTFVTSRAREKTHLPPEVSEWLGLNVGEVPSIDMEPVTTLNDTGRWSFSRIAKGLRKKYNLPK